jgi:hypothetical protein
MVRDSLVKQAMSSMDLPIAISELRKKSELVKNTMPSGMIYAWSELFPTSISKTQSNFSSTNLDSVFQVLVAKDT